MKRAKQRMIPMFARLKAGTRRADRAMTAELIAQSPGGLYIDKDWDQAPPVGRELL